mgnify:CR=1 FL=1
MLFFLFGSGPSMKSSLFALPIAAVLLGGAGPASAATVISTGSFSAFGAGLLSYDSFDASLGTLDRVRIDIVGLMSGQVFAALNPDGQGGIVPYSGQLAATYRFAPTSFDLGLETTLLPPGVIFQLSTSGAGEVVSYATPFIFGVTLTAATDLVGFAINTPFVGPNATALPIAFASDRDRFRSDFPGVVDLPTILTIVTTGFGAGTTPDFSPLGPPTLSGRLILTYDYTPAATPVPAPAAAPLLLAGIGLFGLGARFRRRARR